MSLVKYEEDSRSESSYDSDEIIDFEDEISYLKHKDRKKFKKLMKKHEEENPEVTLSDIIKADIPDNEKIKYIEIYREVKENYDEDEYALASIRRRITEVEAEYEKTRRVY